MIVQHASHRRPAAVPCPSSHRCRLAATTLLLVVAWLLVGSTAAAAQSSFPETLPRAASPTPPATDGNWFDGLGNRCQHGLGYYVPGCGASASRAFPAGCHQPCDIGGAASCPQDKVCRSVLIDPCHGSTCAACGAVRSLCLDRR